MSSPHPDAAAEAELAELVQATQALQLAARRDVPPQEAEFLCKAYDEIMLRVSQRVRFLCEDTKARANEKVSLLHEVVGLHKANLAMQCEIAALRAEVAQLKAKAEADAKNEETRRILSECTIERLRGQLEHQFERQYS